MRILLLIALLPACSGLADTPETEAQESEAHRLLQNALQGQADFPLADGPMKVSPLDCFLPPPPVLRQSEATSTSPHGRKVYSLHAKDPESYHFILDAPIGQVLVKRTYEPVPLEGKVPAHQVGDTELYPYVAYDGEVFTKGEPRELFVMAKFAPDTPGTDAGWIYGTATADGKVIDAGRIESCMECHQGAETRDRQFGLKRVAWENQPVGEVAMMQGGIPEQWIQDARRVAWEYKSYGRFDESARWSPWFCSMPPPDRARRSQSPDADTHGRKLYALFVKDADDYGSLKNGFPSAEPFETPAPVGQVIVKEAWIPKKATEEDLLPNYPYVRQGDGDQYLTEEGWLAFAKDEDGTVWKATDRGPLFLMMKYDPETPGTDQGWVYATVDTHNVITGIGVMENCYSCHVDAPRDRMFGLPEGW